MISNKLEGHSIDYNQNCNGCCSGCPIKKDGSQDQIKGPVHVIRKMVYNKEQESNVSIPILWCEKHCPECNVKIIVK